MKRTHGIGRILIFILSISVLWVSAVLAQESDGDDQLRLGAQVYAENCALCHGPNGEGRVGATLAKDWPSIRPDLVTRETIARGIEGTVMPAWSQEYGGPLTDDEIEAVVAFVLSWQTGGVPQITPPGDTPTPRAAVSPVPGIEGDPNQGGALYDENCAVCHGSGGEGRIGATLAKEWPSIRPDLTIRDTVVKGISGSVMPAWSQENGGPLTEENIDDLVAFILTWSIEDNAQVLEPNPPEDYPLSGWSGFFFTLFLFVLMIALFLLVQFYARRNGK